MSPARVSYDSSTSQPPGLRISRARRAIASVWPVPTTASYGSKLRISGGRRLPLLGRNVGRVRDDEVEGPSEARDEVAEHELHAVVERGASAVLRRESERVGGDVGRHDSRAAVLARERERDRPRAGADVEDERLVDLPYVDERPLDHGLGVGAGYQHARVDAQRQPPEPPLAEDVGGRLAPCAPLDERREARLGVRVERAVGAGVELGTGGTERRGQQ